MSSHFEINDPDDLDVEVRSIASTDFPLLIIDNFFRHPDKARDYAKALDYNVIGGRSPGGAAWGKEPPNVVEPLSAVVEKHLGSKFNWKMPDEGASDYPVMRFHRMRCADGAGDVDVQSPHIDSVMLAGVAYLNTPEQCRGGTKFFRHKETGLPDWRFRSKHAIADEAVRAAVKMGFGAGFRAGYKEGRWSDYSAIENQIFNDRDGPPDFMENGGSKWDCIDSVDMKWNRFVCFPGFVFHTSHHSPKWFGTTNETDRMVLNLLVFWPPKESSQRQAS